MAKNYDKDNNEFSHIGVPFNYTRGNPIPLDNSSVWTSKADAENYAATSPIAYVGQILTVVDKTTETVSLWKIVNTAGKLIRVDNASNAYSKISRLDEYLYRTEYSDLDYEYALSWFAKAYTPVFIRGISVSKNGLFGHALDTTFNNQAEYVVHVAATPTRHESVGIATGLNSLTDEVARKQKYSDDYRILPFLTMDGMNDAGVCCAVNAINAIDVAPYTGTNTSAGEKINVGMVVRYVLDNFATAAAAATHLRDNVNLYGPSGYACQFMISDSSDSYLVEIVNNTTVITKQVSRPWATNFQINGVTFNANNKVGYVGSNLLEHSAGVERWNIIAEAYTGITQKAKLMDLLYRSANYVKTYETGTSPYWYSEYVGDTETFGNLTLAMATENPSAFDSIIATNRTAYINRSRALGNITQTTHAVVYDITNRSAWIASQDRAVSRSVIVTLDGASVAADHSHNFADVWDLNSTDSTIDGLHLVSKNVSEQFGWGVRGSSNSWLYFSNGKWNLTTVKGVVSLNGAGEVRELVFAGYPSAADITVLFRHASKDNDDRLLVEADLEGHESKYRLELNELFTRLGTAFYRLTLDSVYKEGSVYFLKSGNMFEQMVAGTDYEIGEAIPADTTYNKFTSKDLTEQVADLSTTKANKATTLAGYGITDAYIVDTKDAEVISIGGKSVNVATRSYVSDSVKAEKDRAEGVESGLNSRLTTAEARLSTRVTAYVTAGTENLNISLDNLASQGE